MRNCYTLIQIQRFRKECKQRCYKSMLNIWNTSMPQTECNSYRFHRRADDSDRCLNILRMYLSFDMGCRDFNFYHSYSLDMLSNQFNLEKHYNLCIQSQSKSSRCTENRSRRLKHHRKEDMKSHYNKSLKQHSWYRYCYQNFLSIYCRQNQ